MDRRGPMANGRVAIVTGSTSGIGLGIAGALAAAGHDVVLNGLGNAAEIEKTRAALAERSNVRVTYDGADMSDPDAVEAFVARTEQAFGQIDVLVNNAGIQHVAPIEDFSGAK